MESILVFSGIAVSLFIELMKSQFKISGLETGFVIFVLSLVAAVTYYLLNMYGLLEAVIQILATAGSFYAFIVKNLKA